MYCLAGDTGGTTNQTNPVVVNEIKGERFLTRDIYP
jgi:hypothetical protein